MNFSAKLIQLLPVQTGSGKNGTWKKQDIIVETDGQYPKKICISIWGDKINTSALPIGSRINIYFDLESREFNGRWYTDVKAWKIETDQSGNPYDQSVDDRFSDVPPPSEDNDLPF